MSGRHSEAPDGADVPCQAELEFATGQVPDLDHSVSSTSSKPGVPRFDSNTTHPAKMAGYDTHEFPLRMEDGFEGAGGFVKGEGLGEACGEARGGGLLSCGWIVGDELAHGCYWALLLLLCKQCWGQLG